VADRDVLAVVSGAAAEIGPLLVEAARGSVGVVSIVDGSHTGVEAAGQVTVLRAADSSGLLRLWDAVVAA
jgi:hypothetical protein